MRILTASLVGSVIGTDPCTDLCEADGFQVCTDGSVVTTDTDGNQFCSNYYYLLGSRYYKSSPLAFKSEPMPVSDVPGAMAKFEQGEGVVWETVNRIFDNLFDPEIMSTGIEEIADLRFIGGALPITKVVHRVAPLVSRVTEYLREGTVSEDIVMLPLAISIDLRVPVANRAAVASSIGLDAFCSEFMEQTMAKLRELEPSELLAQASYLHNFCPDVLTDDYRHIALRAEIQRLPFGLRDYIPKLDSWTELRWIMFPAVRRGLLAPVGPSGAEISISEWISLKQEIPWVASLLKPDSDASPDRLISFGRFLALALLQRAPIKATLHLDFCACMLGEECTYANWTIIATSFREVIPLRYLQRFEFTPIILQRMLNVSH